MKGRSPKDKHFYRDVVVLLILVMAAIAMLGEVSRQNWNSKVTAFPTKTEADVKNRAEQLLDQMTLEGKITQMFLVICPDEETRQVIEAYQFGGVLFEEGDFADRSKNSLKSDIEDWQSVSNVAMFTAVMEEGGSVSPMSSHKAFRNAAFLSPSDMYATGGMTLVEGEAEEKYELLSSLGLNMNLGIVCDLATEETALMYERSLRRDEKTAGRYVAANVSAASEQNVVSALKHFPGYGNAEFTDEGYGVNDRSVETLEALDLLPFESGIEADVPAVMLANSIVTAVDGEKPACLSREVNKLLRRELGFEGLIITDAPEIASLKKFAQDGQVAVTAIKTGCDLLIVTDYETELNNVLAAVREGELAEERIDESVLRILQLKIKYGIL